MEMKDEILWMDKSAYIVLVMIPAIFTAFGVFAFIKFNEFIERTILLLFLSMLLLFWFQQGDYYPLRITSKGLMISEDKKFLRQKKLVPFEEIANIEITGDDRGSYLEFLRVRDIKGKKYRNVIYEVSKFKGQLKNLKQVRYIEESSWQRFLPKKLR